LKSKAWIWGLEFRVSVPFPELEALGLNSGGKKELDEARIELNSLNII